MVDIIEKFKSLDIIYQILIIAAIVIVIIVIILAVICLFKRRGKESYTTSLSDNKILEKSSDPLQNYVNSWINSVKNLYTSKSVLSSPENYVESRTMKNFSKYTYLDKNPIVTGINKY